MLAYHARFHWLVGWIPPKELEPRYVDLAIPFLVAAPIMLIAMLWAGLYLPRRDQRFFGEAWAILQAITIGVGGTVVFLSIFRNVLFDQRQFSRSGALIRFWPKSPIPRVPLHD